MLVQDDPRFSLVVPAYNEEALLPRLLDTVARARARYRGGAHAIEVIVADDGSTDGTARIARAWGATVVPVAARRIGGARNGGARTARGEILAFADADLQLHPETFNEIDRVLASGAVMGGTTGIQFERRSPGIACTRALLVVMGSLIRLAVGQAPTAEVETGVVFVRRRDFEAIGGYDDERFFGEDVQLLVDLARYGRRQGRRLARGTEARAIWSTRKFDQFGDWHYFTAPFRLPWRALVRRSAINAFARRYWYGGR